MFWLVDSDDFANVEGFRNVHITQKDSPLGDRCHYDIENTVQNVNGKNQYATYVDKYCKPPKLYVCIDDGIVEITEEQYARLTKEFPTPPQFK